MEKFFCPLRFRDVISLVVLIIIAFSWLLIDQVFLPETYQRFIVLMVLMLGLYYGQFAINKPAQVMSYATSMAAITVSFGVVVSIVMHVLIRNDFTLKSVMIWLIVGIFPYLAGAIYKNISGKKASL
jgi:hypothetical protein